jgi:hypothetical protein
MRKYVAEKWKDFVVVLLISASVVCILLDIVKIFSVTICYAPYMVVFPALLMIGLRLFCRQERDGQIIKNTYYALVLSAVEYLTLVLLEKFSFPSKLKVFIYMLTVFFVFVCSKMKETVDGSTNNMDYQEDSGKKIFSLYYINTEKVYEIAMLLNNKVITGGTNQNETEESVDKQTDIGITSNLSYFETVKSELSMSQNMQMHNSVKNKVLENFDVKTTKSNMLASIIAKAKEYKKDEHIHLGDLVLLKNASLKLLNEEESYAATKMILNGAFKDTKISSNSDDMKIEFDLSAMINSILKDCAYELGCVVENKKFLLTIPMTFENDFENSYNIYDLQVGSVSVVGIYRGKRQYEKRLSLQEIFSENKEQKKTHTYEDDNIQLQSSQSQKEDSDNRRAKNEQSADFQEVIDVIAVIQEINAK